MAFSLSTFRFGRERTVVRALRGRAHRYGDEGRKYAMPATTHRFGARALTLIVALWALLDGGSAHAARVPRMSMKELFASSGAVYVGTVSSVETPCPGRKPPCTRVAFTDIELIAGTLPEKDVAFDLPEGLLEDGTVLTIVGAPMFHVGRRYLLFVRAGDWFNTPVTNWFHSVFREVRLPGDQSRAFFVAPDGRAVVGIDDNGFRLGERLALPEGALTRSQDDVGAQPSLAVSGGTPLSDAMKELLAGRAPLQRFALPRDDLLNQLRVLARTNPLRTDVPVRFVPAGSPLTRRQAPRVGAAEPGLGKAAPEAVFPRYRDDAPSSVDPGDVPEPASRRRSHPGQSSSD
jgi:hypothetical protein